MELMLILLPEPVTLVIPPVLPVPDTDLQPVQLVPETFTYITVSVLPHVTLDTMEMMIPILVILVNPHVQLVPDHYPLIVKHVTIVTYTELNVYQPAQTELSPTPLLGLVTHV